MIAPYYADEHVALYLGDFRDLLPLVLDGVEPDLVVADPPYGETSLGWDRWPDGWPSQVPGRSMWCFGSMRMFLDRRDDFGGWRLSQDVVWEKHNGSGFTTDRFRRVHEHALHWYRGPWEQVHHEAVRVPSTVRDKGRSVLARTQPGHTGKIGAWGWEDDGTRQQTSVVFAPSMQQRAINETEKPVGLLEPLIAYGCPAGGLVVDVFAGSCSSLVAARASGRCAVGFELRESQCEKSARRLAQGDLFAGAAP